MVTAATVGATGAATGAGVVDVDAAVEGDFFGSFPFGALYYNGPFSSLPVA